MEEVFCVLTLVCTQHCREYGVSVLCTHAHMYCYFPQVKALPKKGRLVKYLKDDEVRIRLHTMCCAMEEQRTRAWCKCMVSIIPNERNGHNGRSECHTKYSSRTGFLSTTRASLGTQKICIQTIARFLHGPGLSPRIIEDTQCHRVNALNRSMALASWCCTEPKAFSWPLTRCAIKLTTITLTTPHAPHHVSSHFDVRTKRASLFALQRSRRFTSFTTQASSMVTAYISLVKWRCVRNYLMCNF